MAFFGLRKWPVPVAGPLGPFLIAGAMTTYLVVKAQNSMVKSEQYAKDPKNPYAAEIAASKAHH
ncbi:hypothetical protein BS47DRAFT_1482793 [Hydnum rufescens UP504]|uniref:ATP synthase subunit J, mitochondrial n=1 Tax=Hydnum rufescens UP504 TaxID=1448309 RepID=A0A9P6DXB7_9AGAM|nr:hypothetical protein BS47DRAFT_1482793 [Hydnum rufescens UP504]